MINNELTLFQGNRLAEIVLLFPSRQRILMVTDGSPDFGLGPFGLSEFVNIASSAGHLVTTAHGNGSVCNLTLSGQVNCEEAPLSVTTTNYDQVWLFGSNTATLPNKDPDIIGQFGQHWIHFRFSRISNAKRVQNT